MNGPFDWILRSGYFFYHLIIAIESINTETRCLKSITEEWWVGRTSFILNQRTIMSMVSKRTVLTLRKIRWLLSLNPRSGTGSTPGTSGPMNQSSESNKAIQLFTAFTMWKSYSPPTRPTAIGGYMSYHTPVRGSDSLAMMILICSLLGNSGLFRDSLYTRDTWTRVRCCICWTYHFADLNPRSTCGWNFHFETLTGNLVEACSMLSTIIN